MKKITNNLPTVYETEGVRLLPGENTVDDDKAKKLEANKHVRAAMERGDLAVSKGAAMPKKTAPAKSEE